MQVIIITRFILLDPKNLQTNYFLFVFVYIVCSNSLVSIRGYIYYQKLNNQVVILSKYNISCIFKPSSWFNLFK